MAPRVPAPVLWRLGLAMLGRGTVSLVDDCRAYLDSVRPRPTVEGGERIPATGAFCAVANHFERRGLWIGLPSALLVTAVAERRPGTPALHFAVVDQTLVWDGRVAMPGTAWAYRRVAACYGMVTVPARSTATRGRAGALRRLARMALPPPRGLDEPICLYPEGEAGSSRGLGEALPGSGEFLLLLARWGVPLLPVGFAEVGGRLTARIGTPAILALEDGVARERRDREAGRRALARVAALLPEELRGDHSGRP